MNLESVTHLRKRSHALRGDEASNRETESLVRGVLYNVTPAGNSAKEPQTKSCKRFEWVLGGLLVL